jgi:hypothetical protein
VSIVYTFRIVTDLSGQLMAGTPTANSVKSRVMSKSLFDRTLQHCYFGSHDFAIHGSALSVEPVFPGLAL